jgi:tetratricopeptide (TPR) repeat protein
MSDDRVAGPLRRLAAAHRRLSPARRLAVVAAVLVPIVGFAAVGAGALLEDDASAPSAAAGTAITAGDNATLLRGAAAVLPQDLDGVLADIAAAGPTADPAAMAAAAATADPAYTAAAIALMQSLPKDAAGNPDWARVDMQDYAAKVQALGPPPTAAAATGPVDYDPLDLDDALDVLAGRIDEADGDADVLEQIRDSAQGDDPAVLIAHSLPLMAAGDVWGAAANLLVAHEQDDEDASPLVNLAAIANSQNLPAVALALLDAAGECEIGDDDSPVGIGERAALDNNRGHALLLLRRYDDAEAPLRAALARNPELSEAARNLVHLLLKTGRDDEARALVPRAVWRLRGNPQQPVAQQPATGGDKPADPPPAAGSPQQIAQWLQAPFVEVADGSARLPLYIALDLSKQGQIAWPEVIYPKADASYVHYFPTAAARYVAAHEAGRALGEAQAGPIARMARRRPNLDDTIQQFIEVKATTQWGTEPIDTEMHRLQAWKENLILDSPQLTRFQGLDVAQAEYRMEQAADRLNERYMHDSVCPQGSTSEQCCAINRREIDRNIAEMTPIAREYEDQMRVFFRDAYGLSTAIASNLHEGTWHEVALLGIEQQVQVHHARTQQEIAFAFAHAAPYGGGCYGPAARPGGVAPDVAVDAPACSADSQWGSGKWAFSDNFSAELTCGKLKFVAEVNVIGTKKLKWGPLNDIGADLGMHAEIEFSVEGTVTIFAGPKAGVSGKIGEYGGDFGVKDGIYAVIGKDGVQDVGMRVVIGGGVGAGALGGTHDVDSMDFSFVSAL